MNHPRGIGDERARRRSPGLPVASFVVTAFYAVNAPLKAGALRTRGDHRSAKVRGRTTCAQRSGLTLYEVVLSLAILLMFTAVMADLIAGGKRAAVQSRLRTSAMLLCQSKLAEVIAGVEPLRAVGNVPIDGSSPEWQWSLHVANGPHDDLLELQVTVTHSGEGGTGDATASLHRFIRNPAIFEEAASQEAVTTGTTGSEE